MAIVATQAAAYVLLSVDGTRTCGVAIGRDVVSASLQAVINGAAQIEALRQSAGRVAAKPASRRKRAPAKRPPARRAS